MYVRTFIDDKFHLFYRLLRETLKNEILASFSQCCDCYGVTGG